LNGDRTLNPFNFHHFNLSESPRFRYISTAATAHSETDTTEFRKRPVRTCLQHGTCKLNHDEGNDISREDFTEGYALYAYDLTADLAEDDNFNLGKHGNVRLALKFSTALEQTVSVIAYAEYRDRSRSQSSVRLWSIIMNTEEIRRPLQNVKHFYDVYSIDMLPARPRGILVCNLDPSYRRGIHWVCICVDDGTRGDYFDTFWRALPKTLKDYMNAYCERWTYNSRQIQSIVSSFCGHYCIYFCMLRSRGLTMNEIVCSFSNDTGFNDCMVYVAI